MKKYTFVLFLMLFAACKSKQEQLKSDNYEIAKSITIDKFRDHKKVENFNIDSACYISKRQLYLLSNIYYQSIFDPKVALLTNKIEQFKLLHEMGNLSGTTSASKELQKSDLDEMQADKNEIDTLSKMIDITFSNAHTADSIQMDLLALHCFFDDIDTKGNPFKHSLWLVLDANKKNVFPVRQ